MITTYDKSNLKANVKDMNLDLLEAYSIYKQHSNLKYTAEAVGGFKNRNLQSFQIFSILKCLFVCPFPFELFNMFLFRIQVGKQTKICENLLWYPYI